MGQIVATYSKEIIEKMKSNYKGKLVSTPAGAVFRAKTEHAVITAYRSGKVLFQGKSPETEKKQWPTEQKPIKTSSTTYKQTTDSSFQPPPTLFQESHIGSDEAGTGDYFGPITVCAVYVEREQIQLLKDLGIRDSKELTDKTITALAKKLIEHDVPYSLMILRNEKYNRLQKKGWSQGKMKAMLHYHTIYKLKEKIGNKAMDGVLIDQFCTPNVFQRYLTSEDKKIGQDTFFMTKAESYSIAVAAASIIARASFVNEMNRLSNRLGITLPKGASILVDKVIAQIINEKGATILNTCAKTHFANTEKAKSYL